MKALKFAGIALAVLVACFFGGLAWIASPRGAPFLKAQIAKAVWEKKQRTLKIDGPLTLRFLPRPGLRVDGAALSEYGSGEEFASIESAQVSFEALPLLSGRLVVDPVAIKGLKAVLVRHPDGTLNIDDLLAPDATPSRPLAIDIAGLGITDMALAWRDEKTGRALVLPTFNLTMSRIQADTGDKHFRVAELHLATPDGSPGNDLDARLELAGVQGDAKSLTIARFSLTLAVSSGTTRFAGTLMSPLAANFGQRTVALEALTGKLNLTHAQLPARSLRLPIAGHLRADWGRRTASGRLATELDAASAVLAFDVRRFSPLALGFDLDIDRLDLDKYLPAQTGGGNADKGATGFPSVAALDMDGRVRIGSLKYAQVEARKVRLAVKTGGGRIAVTPPGKRDKISRRKAAPP